jgi:hypothetical protein
MVPTMSDVVVENLTLQQRKELQEKSGPSDARMVGLATFAEERIEPPEVELTCLPLSHKNETRLGDRFLLAGLSDHYLLANLGHGRAALINLRTGNRWNHACRLMSVVGVSIATMARLFSAASPVKRLMRGPES